MKLFLCSHFSSVGSLIKEEIDNKKVAFIPTALLLVLYFVQLRIAKVKQTTTNGIDSTS